MSSRRGWFKRERERGVELAGNATVADAFNATSCSLSSLFLIKIHMFVFNNTENNIDGY